MIKKTITFEDFNGEEQTDDFYFHLSKAELLEMEMESGEQGLEDYIKQIAAEQDPKKIIALFKDLINRSYGEKSEDGLRFVKSDEKRDKFTSTAAYSELFFELGTNAKAGADFVNGLIPASLAKRVKEEGKPQDRQTKAPAKKAPAKK